MTQTDFAYNESGDFEQSTDGAGFADISVVCGQRVVSSNIYSTLNNTLDWEALQYINSDTALQIVADAVLTIPGVDSVDMSGFTISQDANGAYSFGTICPVINCDNSTQACTIT